MKTFLSFSTPQSHRIALALKWWLPSVLPDCAPWTSDDIPPGADWEEKLAEALSLAEVGIICFTPDNLDKPWIATERWALMHRPRKQKHKTPGKALVIPYLFDLQASALPAHFQRQQAAPADRDGTRKVVMEVARRFSYEASAVAQRFENAWPALQTQLQAPPTDHLQEEYSPIKFSVASSPKEFYELIGDTLLKAIESETARGGGAAPVRHAIRVGIVCGPMVYKMIESLVVRYSNLRQEDFSNLRLVAMNRAAESKDFQYSANYLVTYLATVLPNSESVAYTFNSYDRAKINHERDNVDILLCSAGTYPNPPKSYVHIWSEQQAIHEGVPIPIIQNCIGDFCLIPVDAQGKRLREGSLLRELYDQLDPHPMFERIHDLAKLRNDRVVILPINIEAHGNNPSLGPLTGKESVTRTVLKSGVPSVCILGTQLAQNLVRGVGDFLLEAVSPHAADKPSRKCRAYSFRGLKLQELYVYDPLGRLQSICPVDPELESLPYSSDIRPAVIISENRKAFETYSWQDKSGDFRFMIDGRPEVFHVDQCVRKPGHFSLMTFQMVKTCVDKLLAHRDRGIALWDMGCGSGIVGILAMNTLGKRLKLTCFTDVQSSAVRCTRGNLAHHNVHRNRTHVAVGNLFAAATPRSTFDVIAFNAPFLPDGLPRHSKSDCGGSTGSELAVRYCQDLRPHLNRGGYGILAIADYADDGSIARLLNNSFGSENVALTETLILYPCHPEPPIPRAYEVEFQEVLAQQCQYRFEVCFFGKEKFIGFNMHHYCVQRV